MVDFLDRDDQEMLESIVVARRHGNTWYLGGITDWTPRELEVPLDFLATGEFEAEAYVDGSLDESHPNEVRLIRRSVNDAKKLPIAMAPGGGFVAILSPQ